MSANQATLPFPASYVSFPNRQLGGVFAPGTATANGTTISQVIPVAFCRYLTVRMLTATNGGTLQLDFVRPLATEPVYSADGSINPAQVTKYTSPASPASATVTAATQQSVQVALNGESFVMISFTGTVGAGTISWVDVCAL